MIALPDGAGPLEVQSPEAHRLTGCASRQFAGQVVRPAATPVARQQSRHIELEVQRAVTAGHWKRRDRVPPVRAPECCLTSHRK